MEGYKEEERVKKTRPSPSAAREDLLYRTKQLFRLFYAAMFLIEGLEFSKVAVEGSTVHGY